MGMLRNKKRALAGILQTPEGRAALKELVGVEIEPVSEAEAKKIEADAEIKRPRVAVLRPVYDKPEPEAQEGLNQMAHYSRQFADVFAPEGVRDASVVHWTRNHLLAKLLQTKEPWTHVLFIDDDIVPPTDALMRMLSHGKDIVGALCTKRMFPPLPTAKEFNPESGAVTPMLGLTGEEGLIEVGAIGTGMILLSKLALEQVAEAYFSCAYETKYLGMSEETAATVGERRRQFFDAFQDAFWFRFLPTIKGVAEYGEDIGFCILAKEVCGLQVYCDTTVQPAHIGRYGFSVKDFLPYQAHMQKKADAVKTALSNPTVDLQLTDADAANAEQEKQVADMTRGKELPVEVIS
ncbi:MAG TPA: hypothetical protein VKU42_12465 [Candidatus Angelobacter sp.]|nr:hypothetical protein [Candidatus Angelobacter sp.]